MVLKRSRREQYRNEHAYKQSLNVMDFHFACINQDHTIRTESRRIARIREWFIFGKELATNFNCGRRWWA
eukprot:scaffold312517_cov47-Attheya_sp.AAC.1